MAAVVHACGDRHTCCVTAVVRCVRQSSYDERQRVFVPAKGMKERSKRHERGV